VRSRITVPADADEDAVRAAALADPKVVELLGGAEPRKVIVVPGRLVNIVR
jgi:leucyl-tRNA synthetase